MENTFSLKFLGTSACEFSPKLSSEYKDCFDKDARRSSALLFNDTFLIDCGIYVLESLRIADVAIENIKNVFITHLHRDHFIKENLQKIAKAAKSPINVWVREDADIGEVENAKIIKMKSFEKYRVDEDLFVVGMPANHDPNSCPQHFIFEKNQKKMYYGCDGGWFLNKTFKFLSDADLDVAVIDSTVGDYDGDFRIGEHNSISMIRIMLPSLKTIKAIRDDSVVILSHMAPSLHKTHAETEKIAKEIGALAAYDGMEISI